MEEYRSCHSIEGEIFFNHLNKVGYCCMLTPNGGQPVLYENYHGELIDWENFFKKRDEHIELMKNGGSIPACADCLWIKNAKWNERKKEFRYILLNIWVKCNLFCVYCSNHKDENVLKNTQEYNLIPVIKDMLEKKVVTKNTKFDIAGGESTLDPHFNELLSLLIDNGIENININTNSVIYSESIERGIKKGTVSIITSIDSGNSRKFEYIKKRNAWSEVWKNIEKYSSAIDCAKTNTVRTKFIILPEINDTKKEIKNFILRSQKANVSGVILNIDLHWLRKNFDNKETMLHIIELTKYFIEFSTKRGVDYQVWAHIEDLIKRYNNLSPENPVDINFIFKKDRIEKNPFINVLAIIKNFIKFNL